MRLPFPPFVERAPWWGPDLQTVRNAFRPASTDRPRLDRFHARRLTIPLEDGTGDSLSGVLHDPAMGTAPQRPLVILIHGLSGTEDSAYVVASAVHLLGRGHAVLRLNLRGAGPSRPLCRLQYHAGRTADLRAVLRHFAGLRDAPMRTGVILVGYSLGGNMLLKFMAEFASEFPVLGAASISAPIDLAAASRRFLEPRNLVYHWNLLRAMKSEALEAPDALSESERRYILAARSIYAFDDTFVGPRNGYANAEDYYADNMALRILNRICHPALLIHSRNDPWIPIDAYSGFHWEENPNLTPLLPPGGGHVGFHGRGSRTAWHDQCLGIFFKSLQNGIG